MDLTNPFTPCTPYFSDNKKFLVELISDIKKQNMTIPPADKDKNKVETMVLNINVIEKSKFIIVYHLYI